MAYWTQPAVSSSSQARSNSDTTYASANASLTSGPHGTYIYQTMVQEKHFGYAAAISVALLILAVGGGLLMSMRSRRAEGR